MGASIAKASMHLLERFLLNADRPDRPTPSLELELFKQQFGHQPSQSQILLLQLRQVVSPRRNRC